MSAQSGDAPRGSFEPSSLVGRVLAERYRVLRAIGEGGMGTVFEAEQLDLHRRVALKLLAKTEPNALARLRHEAMAAGSLRSPHVVAIFDFHAGEPPFLVMELLGGESLATLLEREQRLEPMRAARIAAQLLAGLDAAHRVGIAHRDVKPGNVWIERSAVGEDHVKLLDFGVAKTQELPGVRTATGHIVGTLKYMAPEQLRGQPADFRSDLHAVGVVLYEMIAGARPWRSTNDGALALEIADYVPPPLDAIVPGVPAALAEAVSRAVAKDPAARFSSAAEMARVLGALAPSWSGPAATTPDPPTSAPATGAFGFASGPSPSAPTLSAIGPRAPVSSPGGAPLPTLASPGVSAPPAPAPLGPTLASPGVSAPPAPAPLGPTLASPGISAPPAPAPLGPTLASPGVSAPPAPAPLGPTLASAGEVAPRVSLPGSPPPAASQRPPAPAPAPALSPPALYTPRHAPPPAWPRRAAPSASSISGLLVVAGIVGACLLFGACFVVVAVGTTPSSSSKGDQTRKPAGLQAKLEASSELDSYSEADRRSLTAAAAGISHCAQSLGGVSRKDRITVIVKHPGGEVAPTFAVSSSSGALSPDFTRCSAAVLERAKIQPRAAKAQHRMVYQF